MGSGGTFCPQKSFESTGSRRERAHPLDGCQESIACARSEHGSRRDGSRSGVALGFESGTWARRRGRPVGRVRSAPSRRAGSIRPLAGAAARPAAAVVPAAASASASRANWLAFDERPLQNPDCHLKKPTLRGLYLHLLSRQVAARLVCRYRVAHGWTPCLYRPRPPTSVSRRRGRPTLAPATAGVHRCLC